MLILLSLLVIVLWTIQFRYKRRRLYELAAKLPSLPGENPIIGFVHKLMGSTEQTMSFLQTFTYNSLKLGGIHKAWFNHLLFTTIVDPVDIEKVAKTSMEKDEAHRFLRYFMGNGIIFAEVPIWKERRQIMVTALSPKNINNMIDIFADTSMILADKLEAICNSGEFSVWPYISRYSLDAICELTLGIKLNAQDDPKVPFLRALNRALTLASERIFHVLYRPDWLYKLFRNKYMESEECRRTMTKFVDELVSRKLSGDQSRTLKEFCSYDERKHPTTLDILAKVYGTKKNVEIREEILSVIAAGTDTTAVSICNTLAMLAKYPEIQEKVHQELLSVFQESDRPPIKEDLIKLAYLERVTKETMRLFPPVPMIVRKILDETMLPSGYNIPAGSSVLLNIFGAHRNPKYWGHDAEMFDPDRFLPERFNTSQPSSFMPFSKGPRNCVGYQFAMMSIKAALSSILRRYKVIGKPEEGPIPRMNMKMDIMMKAVDGYQISLEKKHNTNNMNDRII